MRRRTRHRRALIPALAVTGLLLAAGCSSSPPPSGGAPAASSRPDPDGTAGAADRTAAVAAAPAGTAATATGGPARSLAHRTSLTVRSYDSRTGRAVVAPHDDRPGPSPSPGATGRPHRTAVGEVIASATAPGAPHGLLARVTRVVGETGRGTEVQTEPAALNAVLGDETARGAVPVAPASFAVDRLLPGVQVSWAQAGRVRVGPHGATVPLGSPDRPAGHAAPRVETGGRRLTLVGRP
ncbi:hypothetical protein [Streptomyces tropicalis]|uniref:Uncharacterized protein n=1 Tax=Streptomyces tropicalis TaxID=3034234 RepID=A0ABT6ADA1_9ACTN|nr:hypothetical protein [Streptomyces tropicalis]MDF3302627.1 hypothetical protein [Streptomyces tropicalis]